MIMELTFDKDRWEAGEEVYLPTGIYIRAKTPNGKYDTGDISMLDKDSLLVWLKSRGGDNVYAENCVGILLGHGHLHKYEQ
jgi:hypothetical protein